MKLLFVIKALDNIQGGAERVLADVSGGLAQKGHDVSVVTFDRPDACPFYALDTKVSYRPLNIGHIHERASLAETIARMKALRKTVKETKPDIAVPFMHSSFILTAFALIGTGIPVIASEHIVPDHYKSRRFEFLLFLLGAVFIKKITVLSESVKRSYPRFLRQKMVAIANPVEPAAITADPAGQDKPCKIILNVGRLDPQKDQETLIRAFAELAADYPDWNVRIMGEGKLRPDLEVLIRTLDLTERVLLPGTTPHINQEYQNAQIFALPSRYESFGLATAEAMAHGLPAIGFADCPGTNELIIDRENGLLIDDSERVVSFRNALRQLMENPALRTEFGGNAKHTIKAFDKDKIIEQWEALLQNAF